MKFFVVTSPFVAVIPVATWVMGAKLFRIPALTTEAERAEAKGLVVAAAGFGSVTDNISAD